MRITKTLAQNIVFNSMSSFIGFFLGFRLSFEQSRELMLHFCKKYELDQSRTHLLLSELEAGQKNQNYEITQKDKANLSEQRKQKRALIYGDFLVVGLVVPFISQDIDLGKILRLSKMAHSAVRSKVYQHALLTCQIERLSGKRQLIWR